MKGQMRIYLKTSRESLPRNRDNIANDEGCESPGGMMGVSATVSGPQRTCYKVNTSEEGRSKFY